MRRWWVWLAIPLAALAWFAWSRTQTAAPAVGASLAAIAPAPQDTSGFAHASGPRPLVFPEDAGPHNDYQAEWWYYTGNVATADGRHFGYQLTFFRRALTPPGQQAARPSDWGTQQAYLAHFALTDVSAGQHQAFQRMERAAAGLAGAQAQPYRVWLDNWSARDGGDGRVVLSASEGDVSISLTLHGLKPAVLQGEDGYSQKGPQPGNASYYYSLTRLATEGEITAGGRRFKVSGLSWMDHEFSTSALGPGAVGWDWFSLQLADGTDLMVFQIRHADGTLDPFSSGTLVAPDGSVRRLKAQDFQLTPTSHWRSPYTGATYPAGWTVSIRQAGLELTVTPYLADQEMRLSYTYWEGAVWASGSLGGRPVAGSGYMELTGYSGSIQGQF